MSSLHSSQLLKPEVTLSLNLSSQSNTTSFSPTSSHSHDHNHNHNHLQTTSSSSSLTKAEAEKGGVLLIQLLLSCAKHTACGNLRHADSCLSQISQLASVDGDSMQRLAARFASALALRLVKRWPGLHKALWPKPQMGRAQLASLPTFPCLGIAYSIITRTLVHSLSHQDAIHFVDFGSGDLRLWIPIFRRLAVPGEPRENGSLSLNFTFVHRNKAILDKLGLDLAKEAEALGFSFEYNALNIPLQELTSEMIKARPGDALAIVSILSLHVLLAEDDRVEAQFWGKRNKGIKDCQQMSQFLTMVKSMSPKVVLLVEQEADHNLNRLVDRFLGSLHYYSALFDSLDATFGSSSSSSDDQERLELEEMFGREIENIVACEGLDRVERHERYEKWVVRFGGAGFRPSRMWFDPVEHANKMVKVCGSESEGYKVVNNKASFVLCWHDRPLYAVSAWIS
ncbi:scarecrow-like protein 3 [Cannabis sativa]|uniref:scarecrow-like protein 3 n=1 Tax=Cannabis sativa TaxID=3483 RepID=UPI0029C9D38B|nr:scarecrow-like protein 3 [Cannabis sativa]